MKLFLVAILHARLALVSVAVESLRVATERRAGDAVVMGKVSWKFFPPPRRLPHFRAMAKNHLIKSLKFQISEVFHGQD